jgi:hypothetical protein
MSMKPLLSGSDRPCWPADGKCPQCGGGFDRGFAYLSGGAVLLSKDGLNSVHTPRLQAFLHVGVHGTREDMHDSADVPLIVGLHDGQFDLNWCSVACMRTWLAALLEKVGRLAGDTSAPAASKTID